MKDESTLEFRIVDCLVCLWHLDDERARQSFFDLSWKGQALVPMIEEWIKENPPLERP